MLVLTPLFHNLPEATLGAVVIFAVWGLMNVPAMQRYWRLSRTDFVLAMVALVGELLFDVLPGLLIAVILSLVVLIYRASRPHLAVLGRAPEGNAFANVAEHPGFARIAGLLIVRVDAPLFFANATTVRTGIMTLVREAQTRPSMVLLDLEATSGLDISSADMLAEMESELRMEGIVLALARARAPVRDMLARTGVLRAIGEQHVYSGVEAGVDYFVAHPTNVRTT
jgi:SulP family sulfate permease